MKIEGPVGRQYNPGDRFWGLDQGGNNSGGEKWLDYGCTGKSRQENFLNSWMWSEREREHSRPLPSFDTEPLAFQHQMLCPCLIPLLAPHREHPKGGE